MDSLQPHIYLAGMRDLKLAEVCQNYRPDFVADAALDQDLRRRLTDDADECFFEKRAVFVMIIYAKVNPIGPRVIELNAGELNITQLRAGQITSAQHRS